ncbi:MAG: alpha-L-glutamate ligase [Clostridiales bacterium]|nr:MAG: alpha-L-glutamate ligase [Clostridiales bacterium]
MTGWIVYNDSLKISKIKTLVKELYNKAKARSWDIELVKSSEIVSYFNSFNKPKILCKKDLPDYVIFWDKDVLLAEHFELMGIRVFNSSESIAICDNKALMANKLASAGIRVPITIKSPLIFSEKYDMSEYAKKAIEILGETLVLKQVYGSFGEQVFLINGLKELEKKIKELGTKSFIVQEYIESSYGKDIRVNIVGKKVIGAMLRENKEDFRANIALGGCGSLISIDDELKNTAIKAFKTLKLDFAGLDFLFGKDGEFILCELNSNVNYLGFEAMTGLSFSDELLDYIDRELSLTCK